MSDARAIEANWAVDGGRVQWNGEVIRGVAFVLLGMAPWAAANSRGESLSLKITPTEGVITELNVVLHLTITNPTGAPITFVKSNPGCDFSAEVHAANGRNVPLSAAGADLSHCANRQGQGRWIRVTLKPGESTEDSYPIDLYYELARPGIYRVQLSRAFAPQSDHADRSNEVLLNLAR